MYFSTSFLSSQTNSSVSLLTLLPISISFVITQYISISSGYLIYFGNSLVCSILGGKFFLYISLQIKGACVSSAKQCNTFLAVLYFKLSFPLSIHIGHWNTNSLPCFFTGCPRWFITICSVSSIDVLLTR